MGAITNPHFFKHYLAYSLWFSEAISLLHLSEKTKRSLHYCWMRKDAGPFTVRLIQRVIPFHISLHLDALQFSFVRTQLTYWAFWCYFF